MNIYRENSQMNVFGRQMKSVMNRITFEAVPMSFSFSTSVPFWLESVWVGGGVIPMKMVRNTARRVMRKSGRR